MDSYCSWFNFDSFHIILQQKRQTSAGFKLWSSSISQAQEHWPFYHQIKKNLLMRLNRTFNVKKFQLATRALIHLFSFFSHNFTKYQLDPSDGLKLGSSEWGKPADRLTTTTTTAQKANLFLSFQAVPKQQARTAKFSCNGIFVAKLILEPTRQRHDSKMLQL